MKSLDKKLNLSKEETINLIHNLYWRESLSQSKIADQLKCSITTIENFFRKGLVKSRTPSESSRLVRCRHSTPSEIQAEILNGLLLSDFHIESGVFQARLSFGFKYLEFAEFCTQSLDCFEWSQIKQDKNTNCWHSKTKFYENLKSLKDIWYENGIKILPDINITPLTLMYWFLGDGMVVKNNCGAILCSESFSEQENQNLSVKISKLGIENHVTPSNRIRISGNSGYGKLLEIIGKCPVECYKYKFKYE